MTSLWWCHVWPSDSLVMFSCMYKIQGTWSPKYNCFTLNKSLLKHNRGLKLNWIVIKNNHLKARCFLTFSFQNWFFFLILFSFFYLFNYFMTKFSYKIGYSIRLQPYSISFYWRWILTSPPLDYFFLLYSSCLQNF